MFPKNLLYHRKELIGIITFPWTKFKYDMENQEIWDLIDLKDEIDRDNDLKVIIIKGVWNELLFTETKEIFLNEDKIKKMDRFSPTSLVENFKYPTIAAINGDICGKILELILSCNLRICSEDTLFSMNHIRENKIPTDGGTQRLPRLIGKSKSLELILTGEPINAHEALRIGLVNRVVPEEKVMEVAMKMAEEMASRAPIALRYAKEAVNKGMEMTLEQGLRLEADLYLLLHTTRDRTEGIQAFREKRAPKFEGR